MPLTLYFHPLSSFCMKALIALYENDTPFASQLVDLADATSSAQFRRLWPIARMPVLRDDARDRTIPESSIVIEYLAQHYPGPTRLVPADPNLALQTRLRDRFYDLYVQEPMQKIVGDRLRPAGSKDPFGVEQARTLLRTAYDLIERDMASRTWAIGEAFGMADCAAAPALFYANRVLPFEDSHAHAARYLGRLRERPSFARVIEEAQPYFALFPTDPEDTQT
jgi:glutathione S-transferase